MGKRNSLDWFSRLKSEVEAGAHNTGKYSNDKSFFQCKFLNCCPLFLFTHLCALERTGIAYYYNSGNCDSHSNNSKNATGSCKKIISSNYRRKQGSKGCTQTKGNALSKRNTKISKAQPESKASESP